MADNLEAILLRLGLDASGFTKGARDAKKELGVLEKGVSSLKGEMASLAATAAAGVGFAVLIHEALEFAEAVTKVAEQTGMSVESVQFLRLAADQTGTSVESLAGQVNKLQRQLVEAGDNDKLKAKIEGLVGPIENLRALKPEEQLQKVAEAVASLSDPAERTAASMTLLGKAGADAIPELLALATQQDELTAAFARTGGAVSGDAIKAVEGLGDAIGQTKTATIALATELLATAAPALTSFLETVTEVIGGLRLLDGQGDNALVNLSNQIDQANAKLREMEARAGQTIRGFTTATPAAIAAQRELVKGLEDQYNAITGLGTAGAIAARKDSDLRALYKQNMEGHTSDLMASLETDEGIRANFRELRFQGDEELETRLIAMRVAKAQEQAEALMAEQQLQADYTQGLQGMVDEALASGMEDASNLKIQTWQQETASIAGLLQQQTAGVAHQNRAMFELNKAAGIANTVVNTAQAIMKVWADPGYPMAIPLTAIVAAAGVAQLNAIKSAKFGGGGGLAPSQAATPATPVAPAGGGGGGGSVMRVEGIKPDSLITGSMMRTIADGISDHVRDGGKVEWAN